jgi:DNA-directed RNA polymerase specialized sigma24 family protein
MVIQNFSDESSSVEELLVAFENGDSRAQRILPRRVEDSLLKMANQLGGDLDSEQRRDVVQRTWENVLKSSMQYDPERSGPLTYLRLHLCNALRQVRSAYARAGEPKRDDQSPSGENGLESEEELESNRQAIPLEDAPVSAKGEGATQRVKVDAQILLEAVERLFDDGTADALRELSLRESRETAAAKAGYSRRTLGRRLDRLNDLFGGNR